MSILTLTEIESSRKSCLQLNINTIFRKEEALQQLPSLHAVPGGGTWFYLVVLIFTWHTPWLSHLCTSYCCILLHKLKAAERVACVKKRRSLSAMIIFECSHRLWYLLLSWCPFIFALNTLWLNHLRTRFCYLFSYKLLLMYVVVVNC